jgi:hypothetical protein
MFGCIRKIKGVWQWEELKNVRYNSNFRENCSIRGHNKENVAPLS